MCTPPTHSTQVVHLINSDLFSSKFLQRFRPTAHTEAIPNHIHIVQSKSNFQTSSTNHQRSRKQDQLANWSILNDLFARVRSATICIQEFPPSGKNADQQWVFVGSPTTLIWVGKRISKPWPPRTSSLLRRCLLSVAQLGPLPSSFREPLSSLSPTV